MALPSNIHRHLKSYVGLLLAVIVAIIGFTQGQNSRELNNKTPSLPSSSIGTAFANETSDIQVAGDGVVVVLLRDDTKGIKHQKFIIELNSGQTILVSHNIDLAPRINTLKKGDKIEFYGEYEWNPKGGILHWTHHDPRGKHIDGWLRHEGITYK